MEESMAFTSGSATIVNKMNRAAFKTLVGTEVYRLGTVASAQTAIVGASGSVSAATPEVTVATGLTSVKGWIVQRSRSGSALAVNATAGSAAGSLYIQSASAVTPIASGDVITWIAFS
jgi:hypothetical protein